MHILTRYPKCGIRCVIALVLSLSTFVHNLQVTDPSSLKITSASGSPISSSGNIERKSIASCGVGNTSQNETNDFGCFAAIFCLVKISEKYGKTVYSYAFFFELHYVLLFEYPRFNLFTKIHIK